MQIHCNKRSDVKTLLAWFYIKIENLPTSDYIVRKEAPARPLFKAPTTWPSLPAPFLNSLFPLPSFPFYIILRYFRQFPPPSHNPPLP